MDGLTVEQWPLDRLVEYACNPRKNDDHVDRMCAVLREFGFRIPIVAKSDGTVIDGHLRLKAARQLGLEAVPVTLADELTDAQVKAFRLSANRSANWAEWDDELLALELQDLSDRLRPFAHRLWRGRAEGPGQPCSSGTDRGPDRRGRGAGAAG